MIADMRRNEKPVRRQNPSGQIVWVARYTNQDGKRQTAPKPGTFSAKGPCKKGREDGTCCAQHRIWWAYENDKPAKAKVVTVQHYFERVWHQRHPRSERTEAGHRRIGRVMDGPTQDGRFGDLELNAVRPRHLDDLVDFMFREQGRAAGGVRTIVEVLSTMFTDAIRDEMAEMNPALVVTVRMSDPRAIKPQRKTTVLSWDEMHEFARCAGEFEPMIRVLSDCGLRLGEMFALEACHDCRDTLLVENKAWRGRVQEGTKQGDGRTVPIPPGLRAILDAYATPLRGPLFPNGAGGVWTDRSFYKVVWYPARERSGLEIRPHDMRHSFVSHLRAAGVDPADLALATGHSVQTATARYTHATGATFDLMRKAVG